MPLNYYFSCPVSFFFFFLFWCLSVLSLSKSVYGDGLRNLHYLVLSKTGIIRYNVMSALKDSIQRVLFLSGIFFLGSVFQNSDGLLNDL